MEHLLVVGKWTGNPGFFLNFPEKQTSEKMATDYLPNSDRFTNFFNDLETRKSLLTTITHLHKTLTDHFTSLDHSLSSKSQTLTTQIEAFDAQTKKTLESLQNRENAIPERESEAAARIEEQKDAAIADIEAAAAENNGNEGGGDRSLSGVLRTCCRRMDSKGLIRVLLAKRKETVALRADIEAAIAAGECVDVMSLVLDALEEFVDMKVEGKVGMADRRWAVGILVQAVVPAVVDAGEGVASSVRERAARVVEKWKGVMGGGGGESGGGGVGAGEAVMFLQVVAGFGLKDKFDEDYLRKLVLEHATRRDMAKIAVALAFGDKIKGASCISFCIHHHSPICLCSFL